MASIKALAIMVAWSAIAAWAMSAIGFADNYREIIWAIGGAIALLVILMVNVWIYFVVAKDEPWKWFKN
ncbi:MAG: hypothetical protein GKR94_26085 [Gammaproteobacteria bacterium]|nr:hypothetical protein [Gammaproteobacteria bacterium]